MAVGGSAVAEPTDPRRTPAAPAALFGSIEACTRDIIQYSYWFSFLAGIVSWQIDAWKFTLGACELCIVFLCCLLCVARFVKKITDSKEGSGSV